MSKLGGELLMGGVANRRETSSSPMACTNENGEPSGSPLEEWMVESGLLIRQLAVCALRFAQLAFLFFLLRAARSILRRAARFIGMPVS